MCLLECVYYWLLFQIENVQKKYKILKYKKKIVLHVHVHVVGRADDGCMYCRRRGHLTKKKPTSPCVVPPGWAWKSSHTIYIAMCVLGIMPKSIYTLLYSTCKLNLFK